MVTLLYRAMTVGPVVKRVAAAAPEHIQGLRDGRKLPDGLIVRWGSIYPGNGPALNSAQAVATARDKSESRALLGDLAPRTWFAEGDTNPEFPCIVRPANHHAGGHFYVCHTPEEYGRAIQRCGAGWYASELVNKTHEYRVFVCQGHVICVSERFPASPDAVAWNLAMGGRLINVRYKEWPVSVLQASLTAAQRLNLDWCALDVAVDGNRIVVFEANTAPGLRNPFTIKQIARVFSWIDGNGSPEPRVKEATWKTLVHPALL